MKNYDEIPDEEIVNPEQFQVGRNPAADADQSDQEEGSNTDRAGYTPEETEFADGAGTRLDEESEALEDSPETHDQDETDTDQEDADFENPEDDPA